MTTPAIFPAAMISLVALAAVYERRDRAAALWFGIALGLSVWALLPAAAVLPAMARHASPKTLPIAALAISGTSLVLALAALPHSLAGFGPAPAFVLGLVGAVGLIVPVLRQPRPLLLTTGSRS